MKTRSRVLPLLTVFCLADLGLVASVAAAPPLTPMVPMAPKPLITSPVQAAHVARAYLLSHYAKGKTGLRCFAYAKPQDLINWSSPQVTYEKDWKTTGYHGPIWVVSFKAPPRPGASPHIIQLPGDDFGVILSQDGRFLIMEEATD